MVQFTLIKRSGHKVVSLCTDDDILTEVILGVYIYPKNPWILETPSSLKPLLTRGKFYLLRLWMDFWKRQTFWNPRPARGSPLSLETLKPLAFWYPGNISLMKPDDIFGQAHILYIFPETLGFWKCQTSWKPQPARGSPLSLETLKPLAIWYPGNISLMKPFKSWH